MGAGAVAAIVAAGLVLPADRAAAQVTPPDLSQNVAYCQRSIVETDDLLCFGRFELPVHTSAAPGSPEEWCVYLDDQDGCTGANPEPTAPTSLKSGHAFSIFYTDCNPDCDSSATPHAQAAIPRIDHGLNGIYLAAGHGITWGDTTSRLCVENSATIFSSVKQDCATVSFTTAANNQTAQRAALGASLIVELKNIETLRNLGLNTLVVSEKISSAGRTLINEAFTLMDRVVSDFMVIGQSSAITQDFAFSTTPSASQSEIDANLTTVTAAFDQAGSSVFGVSGNVVVSVIFIVLGFLTFWWIRKNFSPDDMMPPLYGFVTVVCVGLFIGGFSVAAAGIMALLLAVLALGEFMKRLPEGG